MSYVRGRAQALVWITMLLPLFVAIAGLAIDGGVLLESRRELQSVADGAARAGATQLDTARLRSSGGTDIQLDHQLALHTASGYLADRLPTHLVWQTAPVSQIDVDARRVHVVIYGSVQTAFLRVIAIDAMPVNAVADADVQFGIHNGNGG
jgi:uncharacterized membrane protein